MWNLITILTIICEEIRKMYWFNVKTCNRFSFSIVMTNFTCCASIFILRHEFLKIFRRLDGILKKNKFYFTCEHVVYDWDMLYLCWKSDHTLDTDNEMCWDNVLIRCGFSNPWDCGCWKWSKWNNTFLHAHFVQ